MRAALAVDDDMQAALLAAALEQQLDTRDEMWRVLWRMFYERFVRDAETAEWLHDQPVYSRLQEIMSERWKEEFEARRVVQRQPGQAAQETQPLPPRLDERLQRHRLAAEPWLKQVEAVSNAMAAVYQRRYDALVSNRPFDFEQACTQAGIENPRDIAAEVVRELKAAPDGAALSVAIAWLYDDVNGQPRSHYPGTRLWRSLNRAALPYDAEDFDLVLELLAGWQYGWTATAPLARALERHVSGGGEISARSRDHLRGVLARLAGAPDAADQKAAATIRSVLGTAPGRTRLDLSAFDGPDVWSTPTRVRLEERFGDDAELKALLSGLQNSGTSPRPSAAWRRSATAALEATASSDAVLRVIVDGAIELRDELVRRSPGGDWLSSMLREPAALQIRAAAWAAQLSRAEWAPETIELLAQRYAEHLFRGEPHSARVANGAVSALALEPRRDSVVRLSRLQRAMWHGGMRKHVERELESLAADAGLTRGQLLELSAPDLGLDDSGTSTLAVGTAGALTLSLDERCRLVSGWIATAGGKVSASPPAELREAEPERVRELQRLVKEAKASLAAERDRVDGLLAEQPRWSASDWRSSYEHHPVLRALGRTLVWNVELDGTIRTGIPADGTFTDVDGSTFAVPDGASITLWDPVETAAADVDAWRSALFERRVVQPVRQVFRETYRVTDERAGRRSTRFAGQLLKQQPLRGLLKRRGWTAPALLTYLDGGPESAFASRAFPQFGVRAELEYVPAWTPEDLGGTPGGFHLVQTGALQFASGKAKGGDVLTFAEVPPMVLSEAMRDVDLVVSVCSVGVDPEWRDVPPRGVPVALARARLR